VPGTDWGDEAPWLSRVAAALAPDGRSVTVLLNGGDVTWCDLELSLQAGRPVVVVAGTGRVADELAAALRGESSDSRATAIAATGSAHAAAIDDGTAIANLVDNLLRKHR
jgi:hypothetical protein